LDGLDLQTLDVPSSLQSTPLPVTFELAAERLEAFPRMHLEPDGSFVWVSASNAAVAWQVDGNLYDRGDRLNHVEIKGTCLPEQLLRWLAVFRDEDARRLLLEDLPLAVFVPEQELWKLIV
jgi:hypothetical protein